MNSTVSYPQVKAPAIPEEGSQDTCTRQERITRSLLGYGVIAGPFYVAVSLAQAVVRDGFDLTRHEWSLLANGPTGWVQIANLVLTGLMVMAAAAGYRRRMTGGLGRRWAPRLLAVYGGSLVMAGFFTADPMLSFPVGTPAGLPVTPSVHGMLHIVAGGIGFAALIATTVVLAWRFRREGRRARAAVSLGTGGVVLAGFAGIASGSTSPAINLAFTAAVILSWALLSATSAYLYRQQS